MPDVRIPSLKSPKFLKPSAGEIFGNLWATKNIDLQSNPGKVRLAERLYRVFDDGDDADFEIPVDFIRTDADTTDRWWAIAQANASAVNDGLMFKTTNTDPLSGWTQDDIASTPTDAFGSMKIFGQASSVDRLVVSRDTDLAALNNNSWLNSGSWWVTGLGQAALSNSNPHQLHTFSNLLLVPDGNVLHIIDDSLVVVASRITLPKEYQIIWVNDDGERVFIGARHTRGGNAKVFPWLATAGGNETYDEPMDCYDPETFAGHVSPKGIMTTVNGKGQVLEDNGRALEQVAAFPVFGTNYRWDDQLTRSQMLHANGMKIIDGRLHFLISGAMEGTENNIIPNMPSGVWVLDPERGLHHKYSGGIYDGSTNDAWGTPVAVHVGGLVETQDDNGRFLAGFGAYTDNVTTEQIMLLASKVRSTVDQRGYFISAKIQTARGKLLAKRLTTIFKKLEQSTDRIVLKYKNESEGRQFNITSNDPLTNRHAITWSDADTFTTTSAAFANVVVGNEIEVILGSGEGGLAHVASISEAGGTYTVNLDEEIPNAASTETGQVRVDNFVKLGVISDQTLQDQIMTMAKRSTWIQLKVEMRGDEVSPEIEALLLGINNYAK